MGRATGLIVVLASAVLIGIAVANRHSVVLYLDPLRDPLRAVEVPVYVALLAALGCGVVLGSLTARLSRRRKPVRHEPHGRRRLGKPGAPGEGNLVRR